MSPRAMIAAALVAVLVAPMGARPPGAAPNEQLELTIDTDDGLGRVTVGATFTFRGDRPGDSLWFSFPGVSSPDSLGRVELNGRTVDRANVRVVTVGGEQRFTLDSAVALRRGLNRLTVAATLRNGAPTYARWGAWHPFFGPRSRPVPISMRVRTRAGYHVIASGRRISDRVVAGRRIAHWTSNVPQGWAFLAIGDYQSRQVSFAPIRLTAYWPTAHRDFDPDALGKVPLEIVRFFESRFGQAGITDYRVLEIPSDDVINFSIDGLVVVSRASVQAALRNADYLRALLSHELAHWWWGDLVAPSGPGSDWLTEGFAEYSRVLYERHAGTPGLPWTHRNLVLLKEAHAGDVKSLMARTSDVSRDVVVRQKGAHVLYMLEQELGGETSLLQVLERFVRRQRGRPTTVRDFVAVVNGERGVSFDWFFEQWLDRPTGPELRIDSARVVSDAMRNSVRASLEQREPVYRLRVPVHLVYEDGSRDTLIVASAGRRTPIEMTVTRVPRRIEVDPDGAVFKWFAEGAMAVTFVDAATVLKTGACLTVRERASVVLRDTLTSFLNRRGFSYSFSDVTCPILLLLGPDATGYRREHLPSLDAPGGGTIAAFVHRLPAAGNRIVIGVEGAIDAGIPDLVLPEAPLSYIALRGGQVIAAHSAGLPRIGAALEGPR